MSFTARYPTRSAPCCGEPIYEGDEVVYDGDDVVHEDCASYAKTKRSKPGGIPAFGFKKDRRN